MLGSVRPSVEGQNGDGRGLMAVMPESAAEAPGQGASGQPANSISVDTLAKLLMMTPHRVRQLERAGWIQKAGYGLYSIVEGVQGYIRFLKDETKRSSQSAAAARVQEARAKEIELRTAREENRLVELEEALSFVDGVIGVLKSEIYGIPARVTRDLELRRRMVTELDDIFRRTADRYEQDTRSLRATGAVGSAVAEDDAG